ncbi:MAG: hypothetical protein WB439_02950 [Acidobacteriaceae bacterium]
MEYGLRGGSTVGRNESRYEGFAGLVGCGQFGITAQRKSHVTRQINSIHRKAIIFLRAAHLSETTLSLMGNAILSSSAPLHGLRTIVMENDVVRVVVLPEAGGKIWQISYKPLHTDLLWNHPSRVPSRLPLHASYDDNWSGGWDELFPNDEAAMLLNAALPDHGELWSGEWSAEPVESCGTVGVRLQYETPITHCLAEKTLLLRAGSAILETGYRLTNRGCAVVPFLFKLHPAFAVSAGHRIDFPRMMAVREPDFPGTLNGAPAEFSWPYATMDDADVDLRQVPDSSAKAVHFFYGTQIASGWCGVTDRRKRLAAALRFDPEIFSCCWLFATYGGWHDLNVAVLEPATGFPFRLQTMMDEGRARSLAPGQMMETSVLFSIQEGLTSIGGVEKDGSILPGDET